MGNDFCCEPEPKPEEKNRNLLGQKDSITFEESSEIDQLIRRTVVQPDKRYSLDDFVKKGILG